MIYDDDVPEYLPGGSGSRYPFKFAPPGLPSMYPNICDPMTVTNKLSRPVRSWKRVGGVPCDGESSGWVPVNSDEHMVNISPNYQGEEGLLPDSIPDELWQTHFRQHDAELNDRKETEYLLSLYKECCGRWPVIYDRWQMHSVYGLRGKSIESLKSKFNKVVMKLMEIDVLQQRKAPLSNVDRIEVSQSLRCLPLFSIKYNEKNEYLRRLFVENLHKRTVADPMQEKALSELLRIPNLTMKKRRSPPIAAPGTVVASSTIPNVQTEVSSAEANRIKAMLKALGIERENLAKTPKIGKLMATIEKQAHILIMMRDSLQRKKQELEILKATGANGHRKQQPPPPAPVHNVNTVLMEAAVAAASAAAQQKRKR